MAALAAASAWSVRAQATPPATRQFTFGGDGRETVNAVVVDAHDNIYIVGNTTSTNLPGTDRAFQRTLAGSSDAFVAKFSGASQLQWATYLGGNDARVRSRFGVAGDQAFGIAVAADDSVWVTGITGSTNFPTVDAYQSNPQFATGVDGFLSKLDSTGSRLLFSTYLGARDAESRAQSVAVDPSGPSWVALTSRAGDWPIQHDLSQGAAGSIIVGKFQSSGSPIAFTRLGYGNDALDGFALDALGQPHIAGFSPTAPCPRGSSQTVCSSSFVTQLDPSGTTRNFTWSVPSTSGQADLSIAPDGTIALIAGRSASLSPINAWQSQPSLQAEGFVAVLNARGIPETLTYQRAANTPRPRIDIDRDRTLHIAFDTSLAMMDVQRPVVEHHPDGPVYTSADRGASWTWAGSGLISGINDFAFDVGRNVVYAVGGGGLFRTIDNGSSWQRFSVISSIFRGHVAIDPRDPDTLYGGDSDLSRIDARSGDSIRIRQAGAGVGGFRVQSLAVSPHDDSVWVGSGNGLEVSFDRGATWEHRDSGFSRTAVNTIATPDVIAHDARQPGVVYAAGFDGILRSIDNGLTWENITEPRSFDSVTSMALDPRSPDRVYAGTFNRGITITDNAGRTWRRAVPFTAIDAVAVDQAAPSYAYAAVRDYTARVAGIMMSPDGGVSWSFLTPGPALRNPNRIFVHPGDPARLYASTNSFASAPYLFRRDRSAGSPAYALDLATYFLNGSIRDLASTADGRTVLVLEVSGRQDDVVVLTIDR